MTTIFVTFQQPGFHRWPDATPGRTYLKDYHRHNFHFKVELQVLHADREVELHDLLEFCKRELNMGHPRWDDSSFDLDFNFHSCETLAHMLLDILKQHYPNRWMAVEVSEDGELGARVEWRPR